MTYRISVVLTLLACCGITRADSPKTPPNVILILADDLGWADLGCYGSKFHRTPALDRLAKGGMRFTDAYSACPVCSPTRAALMTGKAPARIGVTDWLPGRKDFPDQQLAQFKTLQQLPLDEVTLAEALKKSHVTRHIGKWHLGGKGFEPEKQGFDSNIAGDHTGTALSYFAPFQRMNRFMPGLEKAPEGEYLTDRLGAEAVKFIEKNKNKPFFLYLAHYAPHTPLRAKKDVIEKYPNKPTPGKQSNAIYAAMLESLDDSIAAVLKKLDDLKLADNTIVIFTSDNGGLATLEGPNTPPTINTPLREGKGHLYEGGIRVPLIVHWPGTIKPETTSKVPVITHDLYPTILQACGIELKKSLDGVSLLSLLKGGDAPKRDALCWHYPHYSNQRSKPGGAIREGQFKLIEFYEDGRKELFDLKADPSESRNLAADKTDLVKRLGDKLQAWRKEVGAGMMKPNPDYLPNPQDKSGVIVMQARTARVHGTQLRFEPLPHKDTLGYWTESKDYATWQFTVTRPGTFTIEVLQGCGKDQGGSEVTIGVGEQTVVFTVKDTGGWQTFEARQVGTVKIEKAGRHTLTVRAKSRSKTAVMDLRQVRLLPTK
jgi:arylsulfatase A